MAQPPDFRTYLGDGVYASFDGHHVWLWTERVDGVHRIALEPPVLKNLDDYWQSIVEHFQRMREKDLE